MLFAAIPAWRRLWEPRALLVGVAYAATLILYVTANTLTTAANAIFLQTSAPLYLLLLFLPPFNLFVFYLLNGYLLGREYFEIVAVRRLDMATAKRLRRTYRGRVFMAGVVIALLLTVPLVNLITPIVATAFMLHVFEGLRRREADPAIG